MLIRELCGGSDKDVISHCGIVNACLKDGFMRK